MKLLHISLLVFLFSSCSTKWANFFSTKTDTSDRNEELIKSFEVDEKVLDKFVEEEIPAEKQKIIKKEKQTSTKVVVNNKKKTRPGRSDIKPDKKAYEKLQKKSEKKEEVKQAQPYPEDFPEELVKYDKKSKLIWQQHSPQVNIGEEIIMDINYMGVSTGKIVLLTKPMAKVGSNKAYHYNARMKTSRYYSYLYELDDNIDSFVDAETDRPLKYSLIQRESDQDVDDLQLFDHESLTTYTFYQRKTKKKLKKKKEQKPIPRYFQDPLSVIHFVRGLPLSQGKSYYIPIVNKGEVNIMHFKVLERVNVDTAIGKKIAWKVLANTDYSGEKLKKGNMYFWFTADERKVFLKFKAKISIGSVSGDIESYRL